MSTPAQTTSLPQTGTHDPKEHRSFLIIEEKKKSIKVTKLFYDTEINKLRVGLSYNKLQIKWKRAEDAKVTHTRSLEFENLVTEESDLEWVLQGSILSVNIKKSVKNNKVAQFDSRISMG